jgi:putative membrane protein
MKSKLTIVSRFNILIITVASLSFASVTMAQDPRTDSSPKAGGAAGASSQASSVSPKGKTFMKKAAKGGMMEVTMGKLANQNGKSEDVKSFGKRMVTDHSKGKR